MESQVEIIEKILKNDLSGVKDLLSRNDCKPNICDEHGMTPLQHAAYKGNREMTQLLLDQGADVNSGKHEFGYTSLHFAALSGSTEVCQLLLEHGAKAHSTNSLGRTPSQMAAFVGNHACVTIINNFVPKSDVDYYTVVSGFETEPKLPPLMAAPLYKFIVEVNLNPVKVGKNLIKSPTLLENLEKAKTVLELMSEKEIKRGLEANEILSFKFHYLSGLLEEIIKTKKIVEQQKPSEDNTSKKAVSPVELFIKNMLKVNNESVAEYQESLLKDIVRGFPYRQCTTFRLMLYSFSKSDSPNALAIITSIINGQRGFQDSMNDTSCTACGEEKASKKCSQCKVAQYCDKDCQKFHWFVHKKQCTSSVSNQKRKENEEISKQEIIKTATSVLTSELESLKAS